MKVLIIGASGLLAKPVISQFNKEDFQLRLFSRTVKQSIFEKEYEIINGDVFNLKDLGEAINGCDAVHISLATSNEGLGSSNILLTGLQPGILPGW